MLGVAGFVCVAWWLASFTAATTYQAAAARSFERWRTDAHQLLARTGISTGPRESSIRSLVRRTGVVGRIEIPSAHVSAMIAEGTSRRALGCAVGHVRSSALPGEPGRTVLAGHRDTYFHGLAQVRPGDVISVATPEATLRYRVESTRIVSPNAIEVMHDRRPGLTLITCYPFRYVGPAPLRFIVSAAPARPAPTRS